MTNVHVITSIYCITKYFWSHSQDEWWGQAVLSLMTVMKSSVCRALETTSSLLCKAETQLADRFNASRSTCHSIVKRVVQALAFDISQQAIQCPCTGTMEHGERSLDGIIGALVGCHIPIKAPEEDPGNYVNKKSFQTVLLQDISDHGLMFVTWAQL